MIFFRYIFFWIDIVEIAALSIPVYYVLKRLNQSGHSTMPKVVLSSVLILIASYTLNLHIIFSLTLCALPIFCASALALPVLARTESDTYSFRASRKHPQSTAHEWIDELLKGSIHAFNANISLTMIIVDAHFLEKIPSDYVALSIPVTAQTVELIYTSSTFQPTRALIVSPDGTIVGFNASVEQLQISGSYSAFTRECNACFLHTDAANRTFSVLLNGTRQEQVPTHTLIKLLKTHYTQLNSVPKESNHERSSTTSH